MEIRFFGKHVFTVPARCSGCRWTTADKQSSKAAGAESDSETHFYSNVDSLSVCVFSCRGTLIGHKGPDLLGRTKVPITEMFFSDRDPKWHLPWSQRHPRR